MQCFICFTYMIILCTAQPARDRAVATHEKRSLFRDVIESLRIRSQLPEEINHNDDNNLSQNDDRYGFDNEPPELPSDADFIPRRNDRIEMPTLKYRFPKSIQPNGSEIKVENKKEDIVVYVNTPSERSEPKPTTHKPKKEPKPNSKVNFVKQNENGEDTTDVASGLIDDSYRPVINKMEDSSQIGNREYQTVIKPTVIVNFRGTVSHRDSEIRLEKRNNPKRKQDMDSARNIFNINQEIKLERPNGTIDVEGLRHLSSEVKQGVNVLSANVKEKVDDDMKTCETFAAHAIGPALPQETDRSGRDDGDEDDNILQIVVTL
ncbi:uncharacterized protein LOC106709900 [Papilio machaon]|uniref:uncharacterized protein LOC106709900 n=1 Tax=Papilio machaon TaxID=76193 RepID=UPI001E662DFE|nr:uncharacterized protein LOC106709900 [Papilio machaon]